MKPEISIIMPSYNYERFIQKAINSVINQTFTNWELIIIDDGSKDSSIDLIKQYDDNRIVFLEQKNKGVSYTLNKALSLSQGKYICFLDADDKYHPHKLEKQLDFMVSGYDIVTTMVEAINENGMSSEAEHFTKLWNNFDKTEIFNKDVIFHFLERNYICKSSVMIKKSFFDHYGTFNVKLITAYDLDLWLNMLKTARITRIDEILTYYRWHGKNETSKNNTRIRIELLLLLDKFFDKNTYPIKQSQYKDYAHSTINCLKENNLFYSYLILQIIKKNNKIIDAYDLLSSKKLLETLYNSIESFNQEQNPQQILPISVNGIFDFKNLRRKIIPFRLRRFLKNIIIKNS